MRDERTRIAQLLGEDAEPRGAERILRYVELLERWAPVHNLVRFRDREELLSDHILEPLLLPRLLPASGLLVDVGSGAGLPGIPLLCAMPGWRGVLVEPRHKRFSFLRLVIRELELQAEVRCERFQDLSEVGPIDLVTARALGGHEALLKWAREHLKPQGRVAIFTGQKEAEHLALISGWHVLSCALADPVRGRLVQLEPCFT